MAQDKQEIIQEILTDALEVLCDELQDPKPVLRALKSRRAITKDEYETIGKVEGAENQVEELLSILEGKPASSYETFVQVLHDKANDLWQKVKDIETKHQYDRDAIPDISDDAPGKPSVENKGVKMIHITWSPSIESPATGYVIEKLDVKAAKWVQVADKVTATSYDTNDDITGGIQYQYRVVGVNKEGVRKPSELSDVIVPYDLPSKPGKPEGEIVGTTGIKITWSAPEHDRGAAVTGYVIEQSLENTEKWERVIKEKVTGTNHHVPDLELGKRYQFRVLAENLAGLGEPSAPTETITLPDKPDAPEKLQVASQDIRHISVTWSPPARDGGSPVTGYVIEMKKGADEEWVEIGDKVTELSYTVEDLEADTQYQFHVYAENVVGRSDPSQPSEIITIEDETPLEIRLRGEGALAAYLEASKKGTKEIRSIRLMLVGQERVGKTSLVKAFMNDEFRSGEEITDGVDASKACTVPFLYPSKWKPLKRDLEEHIKQLDEKHAWGVALAAASQLDPSLADKQSTPAPVEEPEDSPPEDAGTLASQPSDPGSRQNSSEQSKQERDEEKETTTPDPESTNVEEAPVLQNAKTNVNEPLTLDKDTHSEESVLEQSDDKEVLEKVPSGPTRVAETKDEDSKDTGPKQEKSFIPASKPMEQPAEIPENIRKAKEQPDDLEITFWDFAGQDLYYTTHQVFFNRRAVFALVFDMSKKLEDPCEVEDFSKKKTSRFHDFNGKDFINFWLQSIYTYAAQDSADDKRYPPIFIIGTHKRDSEVEEEVVKDQIFAILEGKQYVKYVRRQFHFVENDPTKKQPSDEEAFKAMKEAIATASMNAPHMKERYPIKWLQFHKAVIEMLGTGDNKHYMTLEETRQLAATCDITDESQFTTMLGLYHDLGTIIWFGEDEILKNTVILDPQWLIDVFKAVITVLPNEKQASQVNFVNFRPSIHGFWVGPSEVSLYENSFSQCNMLKEVD
ncbi:uncharacterized protein [Amphiura filiformis]|uniref:uncharacterized protein n=1 Tax=Amphiura filiformis TaxID=82378 RepID=UPI003B21A497